MDFDLEAKTARLSVGELAGFDLGPREAATGAAGLWRAQLGTHWHGELRGRTQAEHPSAEFEVRIEAALRRGGWTIALDGRIDQVLGRNGAVVLREIKTVVRGLPETGEALRADYPSYFIQLAAYAEMWREKTGSAPAGAELVFVEVSGGLIQTVPLAPDDLRRWEPALERVTGFLEEQARAQKRRRAIRLGSPFATLRPGQEAVQEELTAAIARARAPVLFEAPTGFGKTGLMLGGALGLLRAGSLERVLYLTGKSTGQIQVARTLREMLAGDPGGGLPTWVVRPKSEHCINDAFHCVRDACRFLDGAAERWSQSGLDRRYRDPAEPRDLESLRAAGQASLICPYEITRTALPFCDVCIADYNYIFAPANRGIFYDQPGFNPARTLLLIDEAHNLPSRVAAALSSEFDRATAAEVRDALVSGRAFSDLVLAWDAWCAFLETLGARASLGAEEEEEARIHLNRLADLVRSRTVDYAGLGPRVSELLWQIPATVAQWESSPLPQLWWCPAPGRLALTCLDAAPAIGPVLREYGGVVLATATPGPAALFAESLGLATEPPERVPAAPAPEKLGDLSRRETRRLFRSVGSAARLLREEDEALIVVRASAPWRAGAYDVACDLRVDTRLRARAQYQSTTADTIAALAGGAPAAVFFPSYAYAEAVGRELAERHPALNAALQPRSGELSAQAAWVEGCLAAGRTLLLILGSSYAESIDLLGGRIGRALVVGPALPELNPVQRARQAALAGRGAEAAFHRVFRVPGIQKVNQALGRLVRAPGQRAKVLLHCRRFAEPEFSDLLDPDCRPSRQLRTDADLEDWLGGPEKP